MVSAISLTQPWASLMALGVKQVETRSWSTAYRGRLAIHAAAKFPPLAREFAASRTVLEAVTGRYALAGPPGIRDSLLAWPTGAVLCLVHLVDVVPTEHVQVMRDGRWVVGGGGRLHVSAVERALGDYAPGRFAFLFSSQAEVVHPPRPAKGRLGIWTWNG